MFGLVQLNNIIIMPLTSKGKKVLASMKKTYGNKAEQVFYAMENKMKKEGTRLKWHAKK